MRRFAYIAGLVAGLIGTTVMAATDFSHYELILERKPFGEPPAGPVDPRPPVAETDSFARAIRLSALYEIAGEIRVGLIDEQSKENFFLGIGETHNGIELVSASFEEEEAVLRRGAEMAVINLQEGRPQTVPAADQPRRVSDAQRSYIDRRRARQEAAERRQAPPPTEPRLTGEALQAHLQEYQMEVIRQGLPPLPIPLTPEMDQRLVEEGVLPP
jgi:hypothetical protein